jgi:4-hydroxymandelate synthase
MIIRGIDHVEYYVADLEKSSAVLRDGYGFEVAGQPTASAEQSGRRSFLLSQGQIRLLLTTATSDADPAAEFITQHGDGVAVIAFRTDDLGGAFTSICEAGGTPVSPPAFTGAGRDRIGTAVFRGFGDVLHKLVERADPAGEFAPGVVEMAPLASGSPGLLELLDHIAVCLPAGELDSTVAFYRDAFGLAQIYDERIEVGTQAMESKVVQDPHGQVTFTLLEPDTGSAPGQIDEFLAAHGGAGVQHLAFRTADIATAVRTISSRGVEFLVAPAGYYHALGGRLGQLAIPIDVLRELNVLADRDPWGQMFQIFARSTHERRTFFHELIERRGALTFGSRNIRALYEALDDTRTGIRL